MTTLPIAQVIATIESPAADWTPERKEIEQEVRSILLELQADDPTAALQVPEDINAMYAAAAEICATRALTRLARQRS